MEACRMHLKAPIPRAEDMLPGGEFGELEAVVARALAKDRDGRYASAQEFAAALEATALEAPARRSSQRIRPLPPSGPIQLGPSDLLPDASYPPAVEVLTAAIPEPDAAPGSP